MKCGVSGKASYLTVTDQFCGAGGSSIGAQAAGLEIRLALNHWRRAIDTHAANFPKVDHVCEDISAVDPRRYASTDILITSPECTNHSLAKGARRKNLGQGGLFDSTPVDPSVERSRATMWDVVRFAEFHRYRIVIVENVVDVRFWELWDCWLQAMHALGYLHKLVSLNSMHAHPTPQSRDRCYVVFWRRGNRAPDLEVRPAAPCPKCGDVEAVQTWKRNSASGLPNDGGRYKRQYVFTCSGCRREVVPYYYAAFNAIDWSLPAARIGDRAKPLKPRTLERIRYGLERFGKRPLVIQTRQVSGIGYRVRPGDKPLGTVTGSGTDFGLCSPFIVRQSFTGGNGSYVWSAADPLPTQTSAQEVALAAPFLTSTNYFDPRNIPASDPLHTLTTQTKFGLTMPFLTCAGSRETAPTSVGEPVPTLTGSDRFGVTFPPFLVRLRGGEPSHLASAPTGIGDPLNTVSAGGLHHGLVQGAALLTMRDQPNLLLSEVTDPLFTQTASAQAALIAKTPYLVQYYGTGTATSTTDAIPTVTGLDRHALVEPGELLDVDDCYFRMLQPHELQAGMAFPESYIVTGNNREKVKQIGNAVTPPAMAWLIRQCVASLHPEVAQ